MHINQYINQNNLYYGCYYPMEITPIIMEILRASKYGIIETEEFTADKVTIFANVNSDIDLHIKYGFIVVDEMTIGGNESALPYGATVQIRPQLLLNNELLYFNAVEHISAIHRLIISGICERGISILKIYRGWFSILCTFEQ